jgi:chromosome segregation ATPase
MMLWKRKKSHEENGEIIDKYKRKEQEYQLELEQKNKLILQYIEKESKYLRDQNNDKQSIQELQQKVAEYEQKETESTVDSTGKQQLMGELQQKVAEYEQKANESTEDSKNKQQFIDELQHKITEYEQREMGYKSKLSVLETNLRSLPRKPLVAQTEGHFKMMDRIAKKLSNGQATSTPTHKSQSPFQTRTPQTSRNYFPNQSPSQTVQFNPFKRNQGR